MTEQQASSGRTVAIWTLITGLAVGFSIGRETGVGRVVAEERTAEHTAAGDSKAPARVYKSQADFPADWLKEADLAAVAGLSFAGLSEAQKATALQALNERDCECGCGMGSIAGCAKKDPNCPRSPLLAKLAVDEAKAGKSLTDILATLDQKQKDIGSGAGAPTAEAAAPPPPTEVKIAAAEIKDAPVRGSAKAPVTIVEFSDFQCPFCSRVTPTVKQIEDEYGAKVKVIWKNYPLPFHEHAEEAAEAAMAAHEQGKFWQMHDKLFANQQSLDRASLEKFAGEIGLDLRKFKAALDSGKFKDKVASDQKYGTSVGVNGTPAFFINGKFLSGAQPYEKFKEMIDQALKG